MSLARGSVLALAAVGCSAPHDPERPPTEAGPTWTLAVFMNGDNDLEKMVLPDLDELERAVTPDVSIVVQADRIEGYTDADGDWTGARRYALSHDTADGVASEVVGELREVDMGAPETLADFLAFVADEHPAERTALILWNHGGGFWISSDDTSGSRIHVTNGQLDEALAPYVAAHGPLDLVGFDACNMGQWETAHSLADEARVLVASQAWVNYPGYAYDTALPGLPAGASAAELGDALARSAIDPNHGHTHAAIDLERLAPVSLAVDALGSAYRAMPGGVEAFVDVREAARGLDREWEEFWLDLGDLADAGASLGDPGVARASAEVRDRLDDAIIGRYANERLGWASGLTIFTDTSVGYRMSRYDEGPWADTSWDELLRDTRDAGF